MNPISIASGTHARITEIGPSDKRMKATVLDVSHDSLHYQLAADGTTQTVAWNQVARMDVTTRQHRHIAAGMALGLLGGAAIGALAGSSSASGNDGYTPTAVGSMYGIAGGLLGLVVGGIAGAFYQTDAWVPVALPHPVR